MVCCTFANVQLSKNCLYFFIGLKKPRGFGESRLSCHKAIHLSLAQRSFSSCSTYDDRVWPNPRRLCAHLRQVQGACHLKRRWLCNAVHFKPHAGIFEHIGSRTDMGWVVQRKKKKINKIHVYF